MERRNPPPAAPHDLVTSPTRPLGDRAHPVVRRFRDARDGRDPRSLFVEGARLSAELLATPLRLREALITTARFRDPRFFPLADDLKAKGVPLHVVTETVMTFVSDLDSAPGLIVRADRPPPAAAPPGATMFVLLDGLQSPANAGALLRVAEAAGADAVGALPGTADLFSPKALRASAGSAFRLPLFRLEKPGDLGRSDVTYFVADARGEADYTQIDWTGPAALLLGGEGAGPRPAPLAGLKLRRVRIPMAGKTESLNVAVAAGILLMEARRQRTRAA